MRRIRAVRAGVVSLALLAAVALPAAGAATASVAAAHGSGGSARAGSTPVHKRVGTVVLTRCDVLPHAWCGHLERPWDPTGAVKGDLKVGFAFLPASDTHATVLGTVVPHEGGPGYSTTGSAVDYAAMYGPLLRRHNMLLVDQRGTGLSAPIDCPGLQNLQGAYDLAAAKCAKQLGDHADLYGSNLSADDESAVISALKLGKVELYGDSYGTFYTQVFAGRHPSQVRSIVLDSAYPTSGETQWYPTQTPAMRYSLNTACKRSPACAAAPGTPVGLLKRVLKQVRHSPYRGIAYDADGIRHHAVVNGAALVAVAFGATYGPEYYREFAASLRSALDGDHQPLLRLVAENVDASSYDGAASAYSEGLDAAVSCEDYPQLYNMADPPAERQKQFDAAVLHEEKADPGVYAPFTVEEYLHSVWEEANWCLKWPSPAPAYAAHPPMPPSGHYPAVPTLILSGELDSITTPAEGALVAAKFPRSRQVIIANSFHVTAEDDTDGCGVSILRHFVAHPSRTLTAADLRCASRVPPVRAIGRYRISFTNVAPANALPGNAVGILGRRAAESGAETVADLIDRWYNNYSGRGVGLYGGHFTYSGGRTITFRLHGVRLERDLAVSGTVRWKPYSHVLSADLTLQRVNRAGDPVAGSQASGTLTGYWNTRRKGAIADLAGELGGLTLKASMLAP